MARVVTNDEYEQTRQLLEQWRVAGERQRARLQAAGLSPEHVELAMQPHLAMQDQFEGQLAWYDNARRGDIIPLPDLKAIGLSLIALRIAKGLTQRQLAERLGVNEAQVSKDEKHEYHGISVERAQRIIDAMGGSVTVSVSPEPPPTPEWMLEKAEAEAR
jgi:DNA-binding XRE family transcriptional regulator